ncbi:MAG: hypothetical protein KME27_31120 [Lyngbya sp. HA4199-MV5]|nr:hypothetical protein [Lyngbya sp. HA4199-MV5]
MQRASKTSGRRAIASSMVVASIIAFRQRNVMLHMSFSVFRSTPLAAKGSARFSSTFTPRSPNTLTKEL